MYVVQPLHISNRTVCNVCMIASPSDWELVTLSNREIYTRKEGRKEIVKVKERVSVCVKEEREVVRKLKKIK